MVALQQLDSRVDLPLASVPYEGLVIFIVFTAILFSLGCVLRNTIPEAARALATTVAPVTFLTLGLAIMTDVLEAGVVYPVIGGKVAGYGVLQTISSLAGCAFFTCIFKQNVSRAKVVLLIILTSQDFISLLLLREALPIIDLNFANGAMAINNVIQLFAILILTVGYHCYRRCVTNDVVRENADRGQGTTAADDEDEKEIFDWRQTTASVVGERSVPWNSWIWV